MIDFKFIGRFCERFGIVIRSQSGNKLRSAAYTEYSERCTAYHLGTLSREFGEGNLNENNIENLDETHLLHDSDSHKVLAMRGDGIMNYRDVVSGCIGMNLVLRISGVLMLKSKLLFSFFEMPLLIILLSVVLIMYRVSLTEPKEAHGWTTELSKNIFVSLEQ